MRSLHIEKISVMYSLSSPEEIVLHDFQGKTKIAAITTNNDGCCKTDS